MRIIASINGWEKVIDVSPSIFNSGVVSVSSEPNNLFTAPASPPRSDGDLIVYRCFRSPYSRNGLPIFAFEE